MSFLLTPGVSQQQANRAGGGVPTDGLISYWKLDETSGPVVDSWGDNNGTNEGALRGVAGKVGNACEFSSDNTYINSNYYPSTNDRTLCFWIMCEDKGGTSSSHDHMIGVNDGNNRRFYIGYKAIFKEIRAGVNDSFDNRLGGTLEFGVWKFICLVAKSGTATTYENAEQKGSFGYSTKDEISNEPFYIGRNNGGTGYHVLGRIDEVGVWDRALTDEEITQLYNNGKGTTL